MKKILDQVCRENENTYFVFSNPKIVPFMR